MITYNELHTQNHKITELSNLLSHLFKEREMCDNGECCHLFTKYMKQVNQHMKSVDQNLYSELLLSEDTQINNTAKQFMEGSVGIRRIMKRYKSKWCSKTNHRFTLGQSGSNYEQFLVDSEDMFSIILDRIQKETEALYPMVRRFKEEHKHVA